MGQVITLPRERSKTFSADRREALITGLCALTYLLGFFIAGPMLAIYTFGYASTAHAGSALTCVAGLAVTWFLTRAAYTRI